MQPYSFPRSFWRDIIACLMATALIALFAVAHGGLDFGSAEEGPLETVQEWFLVVSFLCLAASAFLQRPGPARLSAAAGAVAAAIFFFRELEPTGSGPLATYLTSSGFRWHEAIAVAVLAALGARANLRYVPAVLSWAFSRASWPLLIAGIALLAGEAIDGHHALGGVAYLPRLIEETFETFAYAVILACAVRWVQVAWALRADRGR